ncbi:hypothetical protein BV22DRAFT_1041516 [Leucogyrophana mollusca]|uniref:Uncharacterized protein n=1 Tax=Leucogyrophana mollusca TaxID=85980 RepID=A0ACB8AZP9_9AGAM|nr:hypothetical protein BV22DRAFT_1041516 [Leucogyrophana mollusca]
MGFRFVAGAGHAWLCCVLCASSRLQDTCHPILLRLSNPPTLHVSCTPHRITSAEVRREKDTMDAILGDLLRDSFGYD